MSNQPPTKKFKVETITVDEDPDSVFKLSKEEVHAKIRANSKAICQLVTFNGMLCARKVYYELKETQKKYVETKKKLDSITNEYLMHKTETDKFVNDVEMFQDDVKNAVYKNKTVIRKRYGYPGPFDMFTDGMVFQWARRNDKETKQSVEETEKRAEEEQKQQQQDLTKTDTNMVQKNICRTPPQQRQTTSVEYRHLQDEVPTQHQAVPNTEQHHQGFDHGFLATTLDMDAVLNRNSCEEDDDDNTDHSDY